MPPGAAVQGRRLGPLFESARGAEGERLLALRPFYSLETAGGAATTDDARREDDILWPLGIRSERGDHHYWRALLFYGTGVDDDPSSPNDPWRFRLFPFIFAGRTQEGEDYGAFFPFYGHVRDFLVFHDTSFVLFPIYAEGRSPNGTRMRSVLWPFYLTRHGERIDQFRLWPFYGTSERRSRHLTRRNRFVLWPFWNDTSSDGEIEGGGFVLFPIYGHSRYDRRRRGAEESWSVIPPLFQYARGDDGYRKLFAPWPFVRQLDADGIRERHIWPLWGKSTRPGLSASSGDAPKTELSREYLLWPFFSRTDTASGDRDEHIVHCPLPFYFHRSAGDTSYTRLWPFFSHRSHGGEGGAGAAFVRVPEFSLWSKSQQVERNWAPLWSLYTFRRKEDGAYCNDLLWGLLSWGRNSHGGAIFSLLWIPFAR